jgi:hypothetical protein
MKGGKMITEQVWFHAKTNTLAIFTDHGNYPGRYHLELEYKSGPVVYPGDWANEWVYIGDF